MILSQSDEAGGIVPWIQAHPLEVLCTLVALLVVLKVFAAVRRRIRLARPARLNPNLAKYSGVDEEAFNKQLRFAAQITATSSTGQIYGFRIVRQIEAVFEDGHRSPSAAIDALKAAAAARGANAIINLMQERTAAGRCSARGDAVIVAPENDAPRKPESRAPEDDVTS